MGHGSRCRAQTLTDRMRHAQMAARQQLALGHDADAREAHLAPGPLDLLLAEEADEVDDDALRLMFIACHLKLAPEAQWARTLRLVAGPTVAEISRALFVKEARFLRARCLTRTVQQSHVVPRSSMTL